MTARHLPGDDAFFDEWSRRKPGARRSLDRAQAVGEQLGLWPYRPTVLTVVGSKGKGTAAIHVAATLSAARLADGAVPRVGLVTSPGLRTNRERMRVDGAAISAADYEALADDLRAARAAVTRLDDSYMSPTGAFTIAGATWAARQGADVLVLEEGLGGSSDEVSLFGPTVVLVTEVFFEHAGLLGDTVPEIARDLLGVVKDSTRVLVTLSQSAEVMSVIDEVAAAHGAVVTVVSDDGSSPVRADLPRLGRLNAVAGTVAGRVLADELGWAVSAPDLEATLADVSTPGRSSRHNAASPIGTAEVMLDGAISPAGVRASVAEYVAWRGKPDRVIACFPDTKDVEACFSELRSFETVIPVRASDYLRFDVAERLFGSLSRVDEVLPQALTAGGCLAVGTQAFVAELLELLDVPTDVAYGDQVSGVSTQGTIHRETS